MNGITAVVLAAGHGKRFWPVTTDKNILPILGKTFFDFSVKRGLSSKITNIVIVASESTKNFYVRQTFPIPCSVVIQKDPNGMAGAILAAKEKVKGRSIITVIADDLADSSLMNGAIDAIRPETFGMLTVWKPGTYFPGGYLRFEGGRPVAIVEKPGADKIPSEYVYFGGQYIKNADALIDIIERTKSDRDDVYERALTTLMKTYVFATVEYKKPFVSLKYPWHILDATDYLLRHNLNPGRGNNVEIGHNVSINGSVYLGDNVKIFENTKIVGPVYIGENTIIGNGNIIRESYIGKNCVSGFGTDIARSYIGDDCWFHSNYIGDSVLEGNIGLGSGSVLANTRLDEEEIYSVVHDTKIFTGRRKLGAIVGSNVRVGVNTSIMPGIKIGTGSFLGAGLVVDQDIPASSFVTNGQNKIIIKHNTKTLNPGQRAEFKRNII